MAKKIFCIAFIIILIFSVAVVPASAFVPTNFEIAAEGALLVNLDTEDVIYAKNIDERLYPASLTKIMTALVLYENTSDLDDETITISEYAVKSLDGTDSSTGGLKIGEVLTVRQMLYVLLLSSANEGANAIAEHVSGDVDTFVELMNTKAQELGMVGTHYANAHGLHDDDHYTTVRDMYILSKKFLSIDALKEVSFTTTYTLEATNKNNKRKLSSTNLLLLNNGQKCTAEKYKNQAYYYKYAKGLKTGYTDKAGRCLISTASKNGYNYLCIVMKCPVYDDNNRKIRVEFGDTKALYEWAFNEFEYKQILNANQIIGEAPVELSWDTDFVSVCPIDNISAIIPKVADDSTINYTINWSKEVYSAPIKRGEVLGTCDIIYAGEILDSVTVVAAQDVERSTLIFLITSIKNFFQTVFGSVPFLIVLGVIGLAILIFIITCVIINAPRRRRRRY